MSAAKRASLGWGQRYMWLRHHQHPEADRHDPNLVMTCHLDREISLPRLRALLDHVVRRHEALRTTYHHDTGGDPEQRVHPPAPLPMLVATSERDGTPSPAEVAGRLGTTAFDLAGEWPVRACAITTGGVPRRLVLVFNHMSIDRWTVMRIDRDLAVLYAAACSGKPARLEPVRHQPLDLVGYEATAQARARAARSLAWWRGELARLPADPLAARRDPGTATGAVEATLTSPALLAVSRRIAARHGSWPSMVHLTAYNAVMAAYAGGGTLGQLCFTSNRESSGYADVHTCLFSPQLMLVDCTGDPSFTELMGRVAESFTRAQEHPYVPYDEVVELAARESARRGQTVRLGAEVNLVSEPARHSRITRTAFVRKPTPSAWASYGADTYVRVHEWHDAVGVSLSANATVMDPAAVETFLRAVEHVVLDHDDPGVDRRLSEIAAATGFAPPRRGVLEVRGDRVDPDHVAGVLLGHPAVREARISLVDTELVADVVAEPGTTAAGLRAHLLGRLDGPGALRCPDRFRLRTTADAAPPAENRDPAPAEDPGQGPRAETGEPARRALIAAVGRVHGLASVDPAVDYTAAGGRALRIPAVLADLAARGWHGLDVNQLASAVPLWTLAARMTRVPADRPPPTGSESLEPDLAHT